MREENNLSRERNGKARVPSRANLDTIAIEAHQQGIGWSQFWSEHADAIRAAELYSRPRFRRLVNRLLSLVTAGDVDGQQPIPAGLLWGEGEDDE